MTRNMSHRERVMLAMRHQETDRVPVGMICSGLTAPAKAEFDSCMRRTRGMGADECRMG